MEKRFEKALLLAREAGKFLKDTRDNPSILKSFHYDVKLEQDRQSENIIIGGIENFFPLDGYLSEEKGKKESVSGCIWTIDPLDGTFNYSRGIPHCCVSIACRKGDGEFGIVYDFFRDEIFRAFKGKGAFLNGDRISASRTRTMTEAIISFGLMKSRKDIFSGLKVFSSLAVKVSKFRMMGAAALDLCYVASGRTDIFIETGLKPWDIAAGRIIVEEAGGKYMEFVSGDTFLSCAGNRCLDMEEICRNLAGI